MNSTVLLVPLIYLIIAAAALEAGSYAVVSASDQAAKVFAVSADSAQAHANAHNVVDRTMRNFGFDDAQTSISCSQACLTPGSVVTVEVKLAIPLPFISEFLDARIFTVDSSAAQRIDRFG